MTNRPKDAADELAAPLWEALLDKFARNDWTEADVRPLMPGLEGPMTAILKQLSGQVAAQRERLATPKRVLERAGGTIHFFFDLGPGTSTFCLSIIVPDRENVARTLPAGQVPRWYVQHLEAITLNFSAPPVLPCASADLPILPEETLAWMREELRVTEQVRLFGFLARERSREFALNWFKDGDGFFLAARAWIPYLEPRVALVWYAAWSEARLRGNLVVVERADPGGGVIRLTEPLHERLYKRSAHLRQQISREDYEALFEAVWRDRAEKAGWNLTISREGSVLELRLTP